MLSLVARKALVIDSTYLNCSLYDPITGQRKWTFKAKQCLKPIQVLNETHLLIADVTASFVLEIKSGSTSMRFAHDLLQIPEKPSKRLSKHTGSGFSLACCLLYRSFLGPNKSKQLNVFIAVYDIQTQTLIFAGNLEKKRSSIISQTDAYIFVKDWQKSQLNVANKKLYVWNGRLHKIDLSRKNLVYHKT